MFGKKAQVSLEYLIIFGFVIAAVLGVVAYLSTTGMFTPASLMGDTQTGFSEVLVKQRAVSGNSLDLVLSNAAQEDINITAVYTTTDVGSEVTTYSQSLGAGESLDNPLSPSATLPESFSSGDTYQIDVSIQYEYTGTGLTKNSTGTLSGTV